MTDDLERRLIEHNQGKAKSTKTFIPWIRVHKEVFNTRPEARIR